KPRPPRRPAWRRDEREPRADISQAELQLHGLRDAPRRSLHQLRREDRGADSRVRLQRAHRRAVLGCLPRGDRAVLLHATRALARAASALGMGRGLWPARRPLADLRLRTDARGRDGGVRQELAAGIGSLCLGTPKTGPHIAPASQPSGASATRTKRALGAPLKAAPYIAAPLLPRALAPQRRPTWRA